MSTISIHSMEYLRLHLHYEGIWASCCKSLFKKVLESSEQAATIAVIFLSVGLVIFGCMKIGESASVAASYDAAITEMVYPPLEAIPTGL